MLKQKFILILLLSIKVYGAPSEIEARKTYLEDIVIWKISDELKLTAKEEKTFTEINKNLNKSKSEINKKLSAITLELNDTNTEELLKQYRKNLIEYNQISLNEYDSIKKLLGTKRFVSYLKIKNELNVKIKSLIIGEKSGDKKEMPIKPLPPPKVIIEQGL